MLHGKNHDENDVLEGLLGQIEHTLRAVLDHVHDEGEEAFAIVWVELEFILYHCKSASTESFIYHGQLVV